MADEKAPLAIGEVFGVSGDDTFSLLIEKVKTEGKVTGAKFALHIPYPAQADLPEDTVTRYFREGVKAVISNRAAAIFRSSNDYGTPADAEAFLAKYSTPDGFISALVREKRAAVEKLDDAQTLAIKMLINAQVKRLPEGTEVSKEQRAEFKKVALGWKAEGNKNWVAALKKAEAATGMELV